MVHLADRHGRRTVIPIGAAVAIVGALLTLPDVLSIVVAGMGLLVIGFFAVHGVASGWVPLRAHLGGTSAGQAASLYLFTYYLGSAVFGDRVTELLDVRAAILAADPAFYDNALLTADADGVPSGLLGV